MTNATNATNATPRRASLIRPNHPRPRNNMTRTLGTVLPTAESLACGNFHAKRIATDQKKVGNALSDCRAQTVGGEVRYYKNSKTYAVVSRGLTVRWFDVRADGDYPVRY